MTERVVYQVLERFGIAADLQRVGLKSLGSAGGFSGASLWSFNDNQQRLCLRRWPRPHPDADRLRLIHQALFAANSAGIDCVPVPMHTTDRTSFVHHQSHFWELTRWMPGCANYHNEPSEAKLINAFETLARFHQAVGGESVSRSGIAPAVTARINGLRTLIAGDFDSIRRSVQSNRSAALDHFNRDQFVEQILNITERLAKQSLIEQIAFETTIVPLQFCIRDIWHDHILFTGDQVTGIVDFGACNMDTVATDIARLSGSLFGDCRNSRQIAIDAYENVRLLAPEVKRMIPVLDRGSVLISGMNWLRWLYVENRQFSDLSAIRLRLETILSRLESLDFAD